MVVRYEETVDTRLRIKVTRRSQGPSDGERGRSDVAHPSVRVTRWIVGRAKAVRGARIDGARAGGDGKVGALCVGDARDQVREQGQFEPLVTVGAIVLRQNREALVPAGPILLRASCNEDEPEQPELEQHKCAVEAHAGEDRSDRRLIGRRHGGEIHRDGDGDIDVGPRLRSEGKGQVNNQNGRVGDGHVETEAREVAARREVRETGRCAAERARRGRH